jgi:RecB family exonuclease
MMDDAIIISNLNDFIFCPVSIYFHNLYGNRNTISYQTAAQINGSSAHEAIDNGTYSTRKNIITSIDVYCETYNLVGKIDIYDSNRKMLIERKRQIRKIYDGYIFQLFAQYFAMKEMGYEVKRLQFYSMTDNKTYPVKLPQEDLDMFEKFEDVIQRIKTFKMEDFQQQNIEKCKNCIYESACDRGLK